ncbi:hypothetical protein CROQUDRAFT_133563 [Cronartium quercuum f. sp. fusiforme G11]|uniref:Uncharacterized protein n=1 Tax=Cronartium quercuum f. sp. fusiforme G11 TaxID=708437 RepID=A0A9P6NKM1_9BASI|nr:hypothetical protein CROQUDRAFT_133563 [Cronartium quercuum f. sp. fusiforme G11]
MQENKPQLVPTPSQLSTENDESSGIREQGTVLQIPEPSPPAPLLAEEIKRVNGEYEKNKPHRIEILGDITPPANVLESPFLVEYSGVNEERRIYFYDRFHELVRGELDQDETHICTDSIMAFLLLDDDGLGSRTIDLIPRWIDIHENRPTGTNHQEFVNRVLKMKEEVSLELNSQANEWHERRPEDSTVPTVAHAVRDVLVKAEDSVNYLYDRDMYSPERIDRIEDQLTDELLTLLDTRQTPWSRPQNFHKAVEIIDNGLGRLALLEEGDIPPRKLTTWKACDFLAALTFLNEAGLQYQREMSRALIWIATMEYNSQVPVGLQRWLNLELEKLENTNPILKRFKAFKSHLLWSLDAIHLKEPPVIYHKYLEDVASQTMIFIGDFTRRIDQKKQTTEKSFYQQVKLAHVEALVGLWRKFQTHYAIYCIKNGRTPPSLNYVISILR